MSEVISKELLREVLGRTDNFSYKLKKDSLCGDDRYCLIDEFENVKCINIHELAHKCKEWATQKGFNIVESAFGIQVKRLSTGESKFFEQDEYEQLECEYFKPEYTFKVCQWILENK